MKLPYRFINRQLCIQIYEEPQTLGTLHPDIAPPCHPAPLTLAPLVLNLLASQHSFHCTHDSGPPWLPIPLKLYPNTTKTAPFWHPATLLLHTLLLLPCHLFKGHAERRRGLAWGFLALWWHHLPPSAAWSGQSVLQPLGCYTHFVCFWGKREKVNISGPTTEPIHHRHYYCRWARDWSALGLKLSPPCPLLPSQLWPRHLLPCVVILCHPLSPPPYAHTSGEWGMPWQFGGNDGFLLG